MTISLYERVVHWLNTTDTPVRVISDVSGVPLSTVKRIKAGVTPDPSVRTVEALDQARMSLSRRKVS